MKISVLIYYRLSISSGVISNGKITQKTLVDFQDQLIFRKLVLNESTVLPFNPAYQYQAVSNENIIPPCLLYE